ncbi:MAG: TAXI family TRAP transporter solute-binding subunit [Planctomycetota bacterium]
MNVQADRNRRLLFVAGALVLALAVVLFALARRQQTFQLRITAGDALGQRHALAQALVEQAKKRGVKLELVPTRGSEEALKLLGSGGFDVALVQGGLEAGDDVRQVTALVPEPLHLLVKGELLAGGLSGLRGKRLNLSTAGSGTRQLALETLAFAGLRPEVDFQDEGRSYEELEALPAKDLPDGLFLVSQLPSHVAADLVAKHGYRLMPLPFGEAFGLHDPSIEQVTVPAYAYGYLPAVPAEACPTVAPRLLLLAHRRVPDQAVMLLLETLFSADLARAARIQALSPELLSRFSKLPVHPGTTAYVKRTEPVITHETIDNLESLRSFFVSCAVAGFLLWRWQVRRRELGFEAYIEEVTRIERRALELEMASSLDLRELLRIRQRLSEIKNEALDRFTAGILRSEELMASFLHHVTDVRNYINGLILHERDRIEDEAGQDLGQIDALWRRATEEERASGRLGRAEPPSADSSAGSA